MAIRYKKEVHKFIAANVAGKRPDELAALVNKKFGTEFTYNTMRYYMKNHKLKNGLSTGRRNPYSETFPKEIFEYIEQNHKGVGPKEMSERLNKLFGKSYTQVQLKGFYKNHSLNSGLTGRFEKGHIPINGFTKDNLPPGGFKYRFYKGQESRNRRSVGSERVNIYGYIEIKIAEPNVWRMKQLVVWEEHNGPIPDSYKIIFLDGDKENVAIENLEMVTNDELLEMNRKGLRYDDPNFTKTGLLIAKVNRAAAKKRG